MKKAIVGALDEFWGALPKSRLFSIVGVLEAVSSLSDGRLTVPELADAITRAYDEDTMILYRGGGYGLAEPIFGNQDEVSRHNKYGDIVCDLFNSRFWDKHDATICHTDARDICVSKTDGVEIARRLWKFFYPNQEKTIEESSIAEYLDGDISTDPQAVRTYSTKWLCIQQAAITEFFDPRRNPDAKKDEVVGWINAQAVAVGLPASNNIAETIFTIIKPENHDPKKKRVEPQKAQ